MKNFAKTEFYVNLEKQELCIYNSKMMENGCLLWLPNGLQWKENIYDLFINLLDQDDYKRYEVPTFLPSEIIENLKSNLKDFSSGVHFIHGKKRNEFYLNSTTDPVINYFFSHLKTLPFKGFFRGKRFRKGSRRGKSPFINSDEMVDVIEAYYIASNLHETSRQFALVENLVKTFLDSLGVAFLEIDQVMWGNNPFSKRVTSFQTYLPIEKRSTRMASVYFHDQTFSKCFNVKANGSFVRQIAFGFTERFLAAVLQHHRDKYGFYFPSTIALADISLIPRTETDIYLAEGLLNRLSGYVTRVNFSYHESFYSRIKEELKIGSLVHVVISGNNLRVSNRSKPYSSIAVKKDRFLSTVQEQIKEADNYFKVKSEEKLNANISLVQSIVEFNDNLQKLQLVKFPFCGNELCGRQIESLYTGEVLGFIKNTHQNDESCLFCNEQSKGDALYGRRTSSS